jgi:hypothetical protein
MGVEILTPTDPYPTDVRGVTLILSGRVKVEKPVNKGNPGNVVSAPPPCKGGALPTELRPQASLDDRVYRSCARRTNGGWRSMVRVVRESLADLGP